MSPKVFNLLLVTKSKWNALANILCRATQGPFPVGHGVSLVSLHIKWMFSWLMSNNQH